MKIDDIYNSNDSPIEKVRKSVELYEKTTEWYEQQTKEVKAEFKEKLDYTFDMCVIIGNNVPIDERTKVWDGIKNG